EIGSRLTTHLAAIAPGGGDTWSESFFNPATGGQATIDNPTVPADTIVVYVGGRAMGGGEAGQGGNGGYAAGGSAGWFDFLQTRGAVGFSMWGGSLAFDTATDFYFGSSAARMGRTPGCFYSVA